MMGADREQLIEEAAKAAREVMARQGVYTHRQQHGRTIDEVIADVVLGVFEKAHTPPSSQVTDDEREALALVIAQIHEAHYPKGLDNVSSDSLQARTVQGEPESTPRDEATALYPLDGSSPDVIFALRSAYREGAAREGRAALRAVQAPEGEEN